MAWREQDEPAVTQSDAAYALLHAEILDGRLAPGAKIKISEVSTTLGFSPGAVREALSRLAAERMTVATAQKGHCVAGVSREELKDLTRTRVTIEQICLRSAIERGDIEWEAAIVAAYHRLHRIRPVAPDDQARMTGEWTRAHATFHAALAAACGSPWMLALREMLYAQSERYRRLSLALSQGARAVDAEHKALLDACLSRQGDLASCLIEEHLTRTADIILNAPQLSRAGSE